MVDIITIIIMRSNRSISSLRDLAMFLKNNLNLTSFEVSKEEPGLIPLFPKRSRSIVHNAVRYGGVKKLLIRAFDLTEKQAEGAIDLLEGAGWIKVERMQPDWSMGWRDNSLVIFNI
ncbi:MAG: hypothetical protein Q6351_009130 [Candidatus Njordarchaeum guaymaensis]